MEQFKQALKALTVKRLKEEASKYNKSLGIITGYSKMSKDQLIEEMSKHKDKFMHLVKVSISDKPEIKYIGKPTKEEHKARKMSTSSIKGLPKCKKDGPFPCRKKLVRVENLQELKEIKQIMKKEAPKKEEPKKESSKQTMTRDKMELMKLEVERDRFAKNKEEKQALTKQINKIKRKMKKESN